MNDSFDLIVVGAGAAGFFSAINAKLTSLKLNILILEGSRHSLAKVKISGGGRCNVTHACYQPNKLLGFYPRQSKGLQDNFKQFGPKETIDWFKAHGVELKTEADGRLFPQSNRSETIIDCLQNLAKKHSITLVKQTPVTNISKTDHEFVLTTPDETYTCKKLVLATGSSPSGYKLVESLGHKTIFPAPSLFTFKVNDPQLTELAGISVPWAKGKLTIEGKASIEQEGPLLVTHWGLSGPCILKLSAWGARELRESQYKATLLIDWFPEIHHDALRQKLLECKETPKLIKNWPLGLPQRLWEYLLKQEKLPLELSAVNVKDKPINRFSEKLKAWPIEINGKGVFKEEFVTAGGVNLEELNLRTYESLICPGLFIVGELLNIDGVTGGFNFQNAWTSGYLAAQAISEK